MNEIITTAYLAAPYRSRDTLKHIRDELFVPAGIAITSRWLDQTYPIETEPGQLDPETAVREANKDLVDVGSAEHFVLFTADALGVKSNGRGGRHVELGYALARHKTIWMVGERQNIFEYLIPSPRTPRNAHEALAFILNYQTVARAAAKRGTP